jgi:adenylate cyclase
MGYLEFLELTAYDWTIRLNPAPSPPDPRIVLIGITEDDIRTLGQWPLPDDMLAKTLEILTQAGARTIGLDLFRDFKVPPGHEALNSILTRNKDIITVLKFGDDLMRGVPGPPVLEGTDQVGFNDILVDSGGIVRRGLFFLENNEERIVTSFSLLLALRFLEPLGIFPEPDPDHPEDMRLGLTTFRRFQENDGGYNQADSRGYQYLVDFNSPVASTEQFSLTSLLQGEVPREAIVDKVVLIGTTAHSVKDDFYTPFSRGLYANQQMPGMELHAHMVSQLLRAALKGDATLRVPTEGQEILWMVVWGILGGMVGLKVRSPWGFSLAQVLTFGVLIGGTLIAIMEKWWLPLVPPAFTWLISSAIVTAYMSKKESRERTMVMQLFSRHVSPEVANTIWGERDQFLKDEIGRAHV